MTGFMGKLFQYDVVSLSSMLALLKQALSTWWPLKALDLYSPASTPTLKREKGRKKEHDFFFLVVSANLVISSHWTMLSIN